MVGQDVVVHDLAELIIRDPGSRTIIRVGRGVTDKRCHFAKGLARFIDKVLKRILRRNVGGHGNGGACTMSGIDFGGHCIAGILLAAGNDHLCAVHGHFLGNGLANPA